MKENKYGVYKIWFIGSDRVYIGSAANVENRIKAHLNGLLGKSHPNSHLTKAFNKYGLFNMRWEVLEYFDSKSSNDMLSRENYYISLYKSNIDGYNRATYTSSRGNGNLFKDIKSLSGIDEYLEIINKFKSKYNITLRKITLGIAGDPNATFTKHWYNKTSNLDLTVLMNNVISYIRYHAKVKIKSSLVLIPAYEDSTKIRELVENGNHKKLKKPVEKLYSENGMKNPVSLICVLGQFNPFHMEINDMKQSGLLDAYRTYSLIRNLEDANLSEDITLCFPVGIYESFSKYLL